jgi:hypothetical protein
LAAAAPRGGLDQATVSARSAPFRIMARILRIWHGGEGAISSSRLTDRSEDHRLSPFGLTSSSIGSGW